MILPEDIPFVSAPACQSCGTPWKDHKGTAAVCSDLQAQILLFKELSDAHMKLLDDFLDYKRRNPPKTPTPTDPQ